MILRLKTSAEAEMIEALKSALLTNEDGDLITATHDYFVNLIGELSKPTGSMVTDEGGNEYAEKVPLDGYHANIVTNDRRIISELKNITVNAKSKLIKMAGED